MIEKLNYYQNICKFVDSTNIHNSEFFPYSFFDSPADASAWVTQGLAIMRKEMDGNAEACFINARKIYLRFGRIKDANLVGELIIKLHRRKNDRKK